MPQCSIARWYAKLPCRVLSLVDFAEMSYHAFLQTVKSLLLPVRLFMIFLQRGKGAVCCRRRRSHQPPFLLLIETKHNAFFFFCKLPWIDLGPLVKMMSLVKCLERSTSFLALVGG